MDKLNKLVVKSLVATTLLSTSVCLPIYASSCSSVEQQKGNAVVLDNADISKIEQTLKAVINVTSFTDEALWSDLQKDLKHKINIAISDHDGLQVEGDIEYELFDEAEFKYANITINFNKAITSEVSSGSIEISDDKHSICVKGIKTGILVDKSEPEQPSPPTPEPDKPNPEPEQPNPEPKPEPTPPTPPNPPTPDPNPKPEPTPPTPSPDPEPQPQPEETTNTLDEKIINSINEKVTAWSKQLTLDAYNSIGLSIGSDHQQQITNLTNDINTILKNRTVEEVIFFNQMSKKIGLDGYRMIKLGIVFNQSYDNQPETIINGYTYQDIGNKKVLVSPYISTTIKNVQSTSTNEHDFSFVNNGLYDYINQQVQLASQSLTPNKILDDMFKQVKKIVNDLATSYVYTDDVDQDGKTTYEFAIKFDSTAQLNNLNHSLFTYTSGDLKLLNSAFDEIQQNITNWSQHNSYQLYENLDGNHSTGSMWSLNYEYDVTNNKLRWFFMTNAHVAEQVLQYHKDTAEETGINGLKWKHKFEVPNQHQIYVKTPGVSDGKNLLDTKADSDSKFVAEKVVIYTDKTTGPYNHDKLDLFSNRRIKSSDDVYNLDLAIFEFVINVQGKESELQEWFEYVSFAYQNYMEFKKTFPNYVFDSWLPNNKRILDASYPQFNLGITSEKMKYQYFSREDTSKFDDGFLKDLGVRLTSPIYPDGEYQKVQLWKGSSGSGFYLVDSLLQNMQKSFPISIFRAMKPIKDSTNGESTENNENNLTASKYAYESHMLWSDYYNIYDNLTNFFNIKDSL